MPCSVHLLISLVNGFARVYKSYMPSPTKRRRSKAEMENIRSGIYEIAAGGFPMTVRQVAAGEDRIRGDRELAFAALALVDAPGMVRVDRYAAAPWAKRLAVVLSPADARERLIRLRVR